MANEKALKMKKTSASFRVTFRIIKLKKSLLTELAIWMVARIILQYLDKLLIRTIQGKNGI